jgi:hypothetical protein
MPVLFFRVPAYISYRQYTLSPDTSQAAEKENRVAYLLFVICFVPAEVNPKLFTLEATAHVWDVSAAELSVSGHKDILLLVNNEQAFPSCKELLVYCPDEKGDYPGTPTRSLSLPEETGALFLAEVNGQHPPELVAVHGSGASIYQYGQSGFSRLDTVTFQSLFPSGSREPCFVPKAAQDLTGDGVDEWLVPVAEGIQIRTAGNVITTLACDIVSEIRSGESLYITHRLPDIHSFSLEHQPTKALAFLSDEFADFYWGSSWKEHKRIRLPMKLDEKWDASALMKDLTGDGFPDLVITQTRGTAQMYAETQVYLATEAFTFPEVPDAVFSEKGAVSSPVVLDVNGDGKQDLVFIRIPFGVKNLVNFFVRNKISIRAEVYLFDGKRFSPKADYHTNLTMDAPEGRARVAHSFGDFNGDGRMDVVYGSSKNSLSIYPGDQDRFLAARSWKSFEMPAFGTVRCYKLNENEADDIIFF